MTVHIDELMRGLLGAELRSDVQVAHYRSAHNLDLLKQYIFTSIAPGEKKSSVELVNTFCNAFTPGATGNRFAVIANYGHGKSHFALALANYFGKRADSDEFGVILEGIRHAIPDHDIGTLSFIESFKQQHPNPYLILILRGDEPSDLPTKFYRAVKEALAEDGLADESSLPFWLEGAEHFLAKIRGELRVQANAILAKHDLDLDTLVSKVRDAQSSTYTICEALSLELYGVRPDFELGLSLQDAIKWLVDNRCGPGKPFSGLLVLFDEFSAFINGYCHYKLPGTPLQDLLNGIANANDLATFVAFAPHDPDEVARGAVQGETLNNVLKELGRIPANKRFQLHSSLEEVLESYLRKRDDLWLDLLRDQPRFGGDLNEATTTALHAFRKRYIDELKWDTEYFHQLVTLGCYPLHPLTTALLCGVDLQATASPRSVLGFVQKALERVKDEEAYSPSGPAWARPILMVDYFREMLGDNQWQPYVDALSALSRADEPRHVLVLQAMLLQGCGRISTSGPGGYHKIIAELSGLSMEETSSILDDLTLRGLIRRDPVTGNFTLPPVGWGRGGEKIIQEKSRQIKLDAQTLDTLRPELTQLGLEPICVNVQWGHSEDWYAEQVLVEKARMTREYLSGVTRRFTWNLDADPREKARALVIWAIAESEEDVGWYRDHLPSLLGEVAGDKAVPLIVMRPEVVSAGLIDRLKRYVALNRFTSQEKSQVGQDWLKSMQDLAKDELRQAITSFKATGIPSVPAAFRAQLDRMSIPNMSGVLSEVLLMSYPNAPKPWFPQYKLSTARLTSAVGNLSSWLMRGGKVDLGHLAGTGRAVEREVVQQYLRGAWHILDMSNRPQTPSAGSPIHRGWTELDSHFKPGGEPKSAKPVLETLLNAPYGYDWNTLALLFSAWWANFKPDLAVDGGYQSVGENGVVTTPRDLLVKISGWTVRRTDSDKLRGEAEDLVRDVRSGRRRTKQEAESQLRQLQAFMDRDGEESGLRSHVQDALSRLTDGLAWAQSYDGAAQRILQDAERNGLQSSLDCLSRIQALPAVSLVASLQPPADQLNAKVRARITQLVDSACAQYSALAKLEDFTSNQLVLEHTSKQLQTHDLKSEMEKVNAALANLKQARSDLAEKLRKATERRQQIEVIQGLSARAPISQLRQNLSTLERMDPSPEAKPLWQAKREAIAAELTRVLQLSSSLDESLDQAADRHALLALRDDAIKAEDLCDEDEAQKLVKDGLARCALLEQFFSTVDSVRQHLRNAPTDFESAISTVRQYMASNPEALSDTHREVGQRVITAIQDELSSRQQHALERLAGHAHDLSREGVDAEKVGRDLEAHANDWAFLPEDAHPRLESVRQLVRDRIDEVQQERERKLREKDEQRRQESAINNLQSRGTISQLRLALEQLQAIAPKQELAALWGRKQAQIVGERDRLIASAASILAGLDNATDLPEVQRRLSEASRLQGLCDEGEAQRSIESAIARCQGLDRYFTELRRLRDHPRHSASDFAGDAVEVQRVLAEKSDFLSAPQRAVAERLLTTLESGLAAEREHALSDLARLEQGFARGESAPETERKLYQLEPRWLFLPEAAQSRLGTLRQQIRDKIDGDELLQVEEHFRNISSIGQRRKCLERLHQLIEELG